MAKDHDNHEDGVSRRHALECMLWAGTGVLWTVAGGVPKSLSLLSPAEAATAASSFTFLQISDSHVGFDKAANPDATASRGKAIPSISVVRAAASGNSRPPAQAIQAPSTEAPPSPS